MPIRYMYLKTVRRNLVTVAVASALTFAVAAPICAQSLAALAQKEEDRRKNIKEPAKVYTNQDLGPALPGSVAAAAAPATDAKDAAKDAAGKDTAKDTKDGDKPKDGDKASGQKYWHDRMQALQSQAERDQTYLDAVQTKVNALTTDFVNRDDPAQKAAIERERQQQSRRARQAQEGRRRRQESHRRPRGRSAPGGRAARLAAVSARPIRSVDPPILLVEDKDSLRAMLRHALEAQGHTVVEARDQPEAAAALQERAARASSSPICG